MKVEAKVLGAMLVDGEDIGSRGRTVAFAEAPAAPTRRAETDAEVMVEILALLTGLGREDRIAVRAMLRELPFVALVARCEDATREGVEPVGRHLTMPATRRKTVARGKLRGAVNAYRELEGLEPVLREGVGPYLRGEQPLSPKPRRKQ